MSLPKKTPKPITVNDMFQTIVMLGSGFLMIVLISYKPEILNLPHSGFLILGSLGIAIFGVVRFIVKYLRRPINSNDASQKESMK